MLNVVCLLISLLDKIFQDPGEYVPKSFYLIDENGQESEPVQIVRYRRDIPLLRVRRGGGGGSQASSSAQSSASAGGGGYGGGYGGGSGAGGAPVHFEGENQNNKRQGCYRNFIPNFDQLASLARNIPTGGGGGAGATSFASASSSSSAGGGSGGGYGNAGHAGGLGAGHPVGYNGPILFSRVGEAEGSGGHVSAAAQGNRGAFSSSSVSSDGSKVKYSTQSGKY
ncbi:hypothetical protein NQ315_001125 [Exocentrus adspersus]|uniref:Uncharacterized protein n=1 Tax=Exocentrus adspersus TaxID=1586481 RepID=A0AAV8WFN4_9CUCU|nr:hypothetical protein NQ315_001125 [Exocentrus adspersus]